MTTEIDLSEVIDFANRLEKLDDITASEARITMQQSLDVLEAAIAGHTPVNTGALRGSITDEIRGRGLNLTGYVMTPLVYGLPVEYGRKPGKMPPVDAIKLWVIRKGIARGAEADSVAFLIARAIGRRGTKGQFMFKKGFAAAKPQIISLWRELPKRIFGKL